MNATDNKTDSRNRLSKEIAATKMMHHETRLRLEELERVADTVSDISLLSNVSDAVKDASIEAIVNEVLSGKAGKPNSLIERVKGGKA